MDLFMTDPLDEKNLRDFRRLLDLEADYMASDNYLHNPNAPILRKQALSFIVQTLIQGFEQNTPIVFIATVSITYFDRFFSRQPVNDQNPSVETLNLIALSCLSLACKLTPIDPPIDFNLGVLLNKLNLHRGTVAKMEHQILQSLEWRMLPITAFSFLEYFIPLLNMKNPQSTNDLRYWAANHFVNPMYNAIEFTQFTPSIIAASALVLEAQISGPPFDHRDVFAAYINMEALNRCVEQVGGDDMNHMIKTSKEAHRGRNMDAALDLPGSSKPPNEFVVP